MLELSHETTNELLATRNDASAFSHIKFASQPKMTRKRQASLFNSRPRDSVILPEPLDTPRAKEQVDFLDVLRDPPPRSRSIYSQTMKPVTKKKSPREHIVSTITRSRSLEMKRPEEKDVIDEAQQRLLGEYANTKHAKDITQLVLSPVNSEHAFASSSDHNIVLWDVKNKKPIRVFNGHLSTVTCIEIYMLSGHALDPYQNMYLFSGSKDSELRVWSVNTGKCVKTMQHVIGEDITYLQEREPTEPTLINNGLHMYLQQTWVTSMVMNMFEKIIYVGGYDGTYVFISHV